jgi:hypothetical protein
VCTVSAALSPDGGALRIVINRDERRLRMLARPPAIFEPDGVPAAWPVDQHAGGTWAAVNAHGLAFALLNASSSWSQRTLVDEPITRGSIIPFLAPACDIDDAIGRFASGPAQWPCRPFKLLVASLDRAVMLTPHGSTDLRVPFVLSTSSLGDELVDGARRALFEHLLESSPNAWRAQDRLHQHVWPDRRHLSALMSRVDACTVSRTQVVIAAGSSEMRYAALIDGWPAGVVAPPLKLAHRRAVAAA